jgi:hypothetical protein
MSRSGAGGGEVSLWASEVPQFRMLFLDNHTVAWHPRYMSKGKGRETGQVCTSGSSLSPSSPLATSETPGKDDPQGIFCLFLFL